MLRPFPFRRRGRNDIDDAHTLDADAEYALAEADYQNWLLKRWNAEGYEPELDDPNGYDPDDPYDNEYLVPKWERGRL